MVGARALVITYSFLERSRRFIAILITNRNAPLSWPSAISLQREDWFEKKELKINFDALLGVHGHQQQAEKSCPPGAAAQVDVGEPAGDFLQLINEDGVARDVDAEGDLAAPMWNSIRLPSLAASSWRPLRPHARRASPDRTRALPLETVRGSQVFKALAARSLWRSGRRRREAL